MRLQPPQRPGPPGDGFVPSTHFGLGVAALRRVGPNRHVRMGVRAYYCRRTQAGDRGDTTL
jgi:hypothetical protein